MVKESKLCVGPLEIMKKRMLQIIKIEVPFWELHIMLIHNTQCCILVIQSGVCSRKHSCWLETWSFHFPDDHGSLWQDYRTPWRSYHRKWVRHSLLLVWSSYSYCSSGRFLCNEIAKTSIEDHIWPWKRLLHCYSCTQIEIHLFLFL